MSDVIPPPPPRRDSGGCWKWGAISCIGLGCVGAIAIAVIFYMVMQSPMFKQAVRSTQEAAVITQQLPEVGGALAKYRNDTGDYPKKLDDLAPKYIAAEKLRWRGGPYVYSKPPKDATESFPVITVEVPIVAGGPPLVIRMLKDGTVEQAKPGNSPMRSMPQPPGDK